jgi:hypothetical protein
MRISVSRDGFAPNKYISLPHRHSGNSVDPGTNRLSNLPPLSIPPPPTEHPAQMPMVLAHIEANQPPPGLELAEQAYNAHEPGLSKIQLYDIIWIYEEAGDAKDCVKVRDNKTGRLAVWPSFERGTEPFWLTAFLPVRFPSSPSNWLEVSSRFSGVYAFVG